MSMDTASNNPLRSWGGNAVKTEQTKTPPNYKYATSFEVARTQPQDLYGGNMPAQTETYGENARTHLEEVKCLQN